jgi:hypothetical protein
VTDNTVMRFSLPRRIVPLVLLAVFALMAAAPQPAPAMPNAKRLAKACQSALKKKKAAARTSAVARPTPIRLRPARKRAAVRRATRIRCSKIQTRRRVVLPKSPAAPAPGAPAGTAAPQPGAPPTPQGPGTPTPDDPAPGGDTTAPLPPSNPFAVQVLSGEFVLQLSKPEVHAGSVRVEFNNRSAEDPHDLHVFREDGTGSSYAFGELQSGEVEAKTLKLNAGSWRLLCALPEHAERGMSVKLRVVNG